MTTQSNVAAGTWNNLHNVNNNADPGQTSLLSPGGRLGKSSSKYNPKHNKGSSRALFAKLGLAITIQVGPTLW